MRRILIVSVNVDVNKRRVNINLTALCGLPEGVNAVFNGRKFDHVSHSRIHAQVAGGRSRVSGERRN